MEIYPVDSQDRKMCKDGIVPFDNYLESMKSIYWNMEQFPFTWYKQMGSFESIGVINFKVHSLQNYLTKIATDCFPNTGRITFVLNEGTHIGFKIPMYKATFQPLIEEGMDLNFTDSGTLLKGGASLDYFQIEKTVSKLYRENIYHFKDDEPASLQITCMHALHDFDCFDWNVIYEERLLPCHVFKAFVNYTVVRHPITWMAYDLLRVYALLNSGSKSEINFTKNMVAKNNNEYTRISRTIKELQPKFTCVLCHRIHDIDDAVPSCDDRFDYQALRKRYPSYSRRLAYHFSNLHVFRHCTETPRSPEWYRTYNYTIRIRTEIRYFTTLK